jgi:outer membrane protein OmpA-like peptidoglycan-associated protein
MLVLGLGESAPVASNDTEAGRSTNRRVQLHISVPNAPSAS